MFDRTMLRRDLTDCAGRLLARAGTIVSAETIEEAASSARPGDRRVLGATFLAGDLDEVLQDRTLSSMLRDDAARAQVRGVVGAAELTLPLLEEMEAAREGDPVRHRHALLTAVVTSRLLCGLPGSARACPAIAAAALLHDLGMRHVPPRVTRSSEPVHGGDAVEIAEHPFLGALQIACQIGVHPAVEVALAHHWRDGQGYPDLRRPPSAATGVVAVASAFAALTHARSYRSEPFDARTATDLLVAEAASGHAEPYAVKLLVHALRGGKGEVSAIRYARARPVALPATNRHTRIVAPSSLRI